MGAKPAQGARASKCLPERNTPKLAAKITRNSPTRELVDSARQGDRLSLARVISKVESGGTAAVEVSKIVYPLAGNGYTVGITGAPGAGKSTLTDRLISKARERGLVGVVAIDPTSPFSGGAILGDRVRMGGHSTDPGVYIRSMATRGHLGGLAVAVPEAIRVLDASGFDCVIVETVGVGQVEVEVAGMADTTCVVVNPGWGDAVQAAKAGLMEVADIFVVNKADRPGTRETVRDLELMLDMGTTEKSWRPPIVQTVAANGDGVDQLWEQIEKHRDHLSASGELETRRLQRIEDELVSMMSRTLASKMKNLLDSGELSGIKKRLQGREIDPYQAAEELYKEAVS